MVVVTLQLYEDFVGLGAALGSKKDVVLVRPDFLSSGGTHVTELLRIIQGEGIVLRIGGGSGFVPRLNVPPPGTTPLLLADAEADFPQATVIPANTGVTVV